jgi:hypothetical protein
VNHVDTTIIHNTYNTTVTNITVNHVSYNGGNGGVEAHATPQQESYASEHHVPPVAAQTQHVQEARNTPALRASTNQGKPPIAATAKAGDFRTGVVPSKQAGGEYKAPPATAAHNNEKPAANEARPGTEKRPENAPATTSASPNHASEVQPHKSTPPNTGNPATDKKYQQQQDKLAAKQTQEHQKLQQQQEKQHQQATKQNYSDAQKQQLEQQHSQQTQQLEQKHATQQKQMDQHQSPPKAPPKPADKPPSQKPN